MNEEDNTGSDEGDTSEDTSDGDKAPQMIPKERLDAELGKRRALESDIAALRETTANLQGQLDAGKKPAAPREYTSSELAQAVVNQEISQVDADTIRDKQLEDRIVAKVAETVATTTASQARATTVQADKTRYIEAYPDILVEGTELRSRVQEEYSFLTGTMGHPANAETDVLAMRAVVGPSSKIGKVKKATPLREVDEQGGSGGDNPPDPGDKKVKLSSDEKAYYSPMVGKGKMYPTWDDVHAEMKFSNSGMRERMQRLV